MSDSEGETTIQQLLEETVHALSEAGVDDPRREARALLSETLGIQGSHVLAHPERLVPAEARQRFREVVSRRADREPFAYITAHREFYGLDLEVSPAVLIPRPETELLVERAIEAAARLREKSPADLVAADLGTGSGAVAVALARRVAGLKIVAVDSSPEALEVARRNAERHGVLGAIDFRRGDLLKPVHQRVDLLVANLPYVPSEEIGGLMPEVARYEPRQALDGGPDGTAVIRRALEEAVDGTSPQCVLLFEIGEGQGEELGRYASTLFPDATVEIDRDYAGLERLLSVWRQR